MPDPSPPPGAWTARAQVAEAIAALVLARLIVATVPLKRWRGALGCQVDGAALADTLRTGTPADPLPANLGARRLAGAVERAAARLPGETRCLARALALHAMLRRRRSGSTLVVGVRPLTERGSLDDLHAWVLRQREVLIGGGEPNYIPLVGFSIEPPDSPR